MWGINLKRVNIYKVSILKTGVSEHLSDWIKASECIQGFYFEDWSLRT